VDTQQGNDTNDGRATSRAWKTLARITTATFQPGDVVAFKRGQTWTGSATLDESGTASNPITVAAWGTGTPPTLTNPGQFPGCQPINMFGERNQSPNALDYIYQDTNFQVLSKMDDFAASLSGDVLQAWAGPLSAALNFEYRQQSIAQTSTARVVEGMKGIGCEGIGRTQND